MKIEILGVGCPKCKMLAANVETAVKESGITAEIVKVTDLKKIGDYGVMMTPALVVDGEVKIVGKVPPAAEIREILGC